MWEKDEKADHWWKYNIRIGWKLYAYKGSVGQKRKKGVKQR